VKPLEETFMAQLTSGEPDRELVSQLNQGSGAALTALFDRHADAQRLAASLT